MLGGDEPAEQAATLVTTSNYVHAMLITHSTLRTNARILRFPTPHRSPLATLGRGVVQSVYDTRKAYCNADKDLHLA